MKYISDSELRKVGEAFLKKNGLIRHLIGPMDELYESGISKILSGGRPIVVSERGNEEDKKSGIYTKKCKIKFSNVNVASPRIVISAASDDKSKASKFKKINISPIEAINRRESYLSEITYKINIELSAYNKEGKRISHTSKDLDSERIKIPTMVMSNRCHLRTMTKDELVLRNENDSEIGGHFIIKGNEYVISSTDIPSPNIFKVYPATMAKDKVLIKGEFICVDGTLDSSFSNRISVNVVPNDILISLDSIEKRFSREKLFSLYTLLDILNMTDQDKRTIDNISRGDRGISNFVTMMINNNRTIHEPMEDGTYSQAIRDFYMLLYKEPLHSEEQYDEMLTYVYKIFDTNCLTMFGTTPKSREKKMEFIFYLSFVSICCYLNRDDTLLFTDRDSAISKRVSTPGDAFAKTLKNIFSGTINKQLRKNAYDTLRENPFSAIKESQIISNKMKDTSEDFIRKMSQSINARNSNINKEGKKTFNNLIYASSLNQKNFINTVQQKRLIETASFNGKSISASNREKEMRSVHSSMAGCKCPATSPTEGANVGIKNQLALFATISQDEPDDPIKEFLLEHKDIEENWFGHNPTEKCIFMVNGLPIGVSKDVESGYKIYKEARALKRKGVIPRTTSILFNEILNEILFFTDKGRIYRPCIVVDPETNQPLVTEEDLKDPNFDTLLEEGKVEYICNDENATVRIASCFNDLVNANMSPGNSESFEYLELCQGIISITASTAPFANHNHQTRLVYQIAQVKQATGRHLTNAHQRHDKETVYQHVTHAPIIKTVANDLIDHHNGLTIMFAIAAYSSENQEDSVVMKSSLIKNGAYSSVKYDTHVVPIEQNDKLGIHQDVSFNKEWFKNIDPDTKIIKKNSIIGTEKTALVAKYTVPTGSSVTSSAKDNSFYTFNPLELEYVNNCNVTHSDGSHRVTVSVYKDRPVVVGDKLSSRSGQKGIVGYICEDNEMPYSETGIIPDVIFNPHGFPTRMTIAQIIEGPLTKMCIDYGFRLDGTIFTSIPDVVFMDGDVDFDEYKRKIEEEMYDFENKKEVVARTLEIAKSIREYLVNTSFSEETMYNGTTGLKMDKKMTIVPIYYQRLEKAVLDSMYVAAETNNDAATRQPADGQKKNGGLRVGEMENNILSSHGAAYTIREKFHHHSDGIEEDVCACGAPILRNFVRDTYMCPYCKNNTEPFKMETTYMARLSRDVLRSTGIELRTKPVGNIIYERVGVEETED